MDNTTHAVGKPLDKSASITRDANYALTMLLVAYILSFIDRQILGLLVGPIRADFDISDFQFSLLHGFAFAVFYTALGFPIGRAADRFNRKKIIMTGVFLWSLATCFSAAAKNFTSLFIARMTVGVGEASLSPAAASMLSDYFSPKKLPRAMATYSLGITLGGGLAYIIGGAVYDAFDAMEPIALPLIGVLTAWQWTFVAVGAPGLLVVLLMSFMKEPSRRGQDAELPDVVPMKEAIQYVLQRRVAFGSIMLGVSMLSIIGYGTMAWYVEMIVRNFATPKSEIGLQFGLIFIIAGSLGTLTLAWFTERLSAKGHADASLRTLLVVALAQWIPAALAPQMPSASLTMLVTIPVVFFQYGYFGISLAALQRITPNQLRGQVSALFLFCTNILGLALGPTIVASFTDFVFENDAMLSHSLTTVACICSPIAALLFYKGLKKYREEVQASESWN